MFKSSPWSRLFGKRNSVARVNASRSQRHRLRCELLESRRVLATFAVTTTNDTVAVNLLTGEDASGTVSIRSAIMAANSQPGSHVINIPDSEAPYFLTLDGASENFAATGDLDIRSTIEINASPATILEARIVDRVFEVQGIGNLTINGLQMMGGISLQGGAIYNRGTLALNNSTVIGTAGEQVLTIAVTIDLTPKNAWGGAIFNAASGQLTINNSVIQGTARGSGGFGSPDSPGMRGGHAYGGAVYNLGTLNTFGTQFLGDAYGGLGGDGATGADGIDSVEGQPATNGQPGLAGGAGGFAYGGVIYNGPLGSVSFAQATIAGNAWGGFGGRGGNGGRGGAASALDGIVAGQAGVGGSGGPGGLAYGGGIYNAGGEVSFATGDLGNSRVRSNANAGFGGEGGAGGTGGSGDISLTEQLASGSNGGAGGLGGIGGVAYGGGIYTQSGIVNLGQADLSSLEAEVPFGAYGGLGGAGGAGGAGGDVFASIGNGNGGTGARGGRGGTAEGGGLYVRAGNVTVQNSRIEAYQASGGDSGPSGLGGSASEGLPGSTSTGATGAAGQGGGIAQRGGSLNISDSSLYLNEALGGEGGASGDGLAAGMGGLAQGGAIFIGAGTMFMSRSLVDSNSSLGGAGGFAAVNNLGFVGTDGGIGGSAQGGAFGCAGWLLVSDIEESQPSKDNSASGAV